MRIFFLLPFFLFQFSAFAQVHQPLLPHLNDLPAFPLSSADAYSKCSDKTTGACNADTVLSVFNAKHLAITKQLNATIYAASNTAMPDTSFVANVKNMTPEQQKAWAMQYAMQQQAAAAAQPVKLPSAGETEFMKEYSASVLTQSTFNDSIALPWQRFTSEFSKRKNEIDEKYRTELGRCPHSNNGEGDGGPDPVCAANVEKQYQSRLESYYADWLSRVQSFVGKKKTEIQNRYVTMENLLAQNNYMSTPSSSIYRTDATGLQQTILSTEFVLSQIMTDVWSNGCTIQNNIIHSSEREADLKKNK
jgi:hypothetical protein